jgi:hypothetical protein
LTAKTTRLEERVSVTTRQDPRPPRLGAAYRPGDRVEVHKTTCESPAQHARVTVLGTVYDVHAGPALLVVTDAGEWCELFPGDSPHWRPGSCTALQPRERAA